MHNDPCGLCCVVLTYSLLTFADYVVDHALLRPWLGETANYYALKCSFFLISFLAMFSHARAMTTDPGAVPLEYQPDTLLGAESGNKMAMCSRCNGYKPPRAHHCSQCDRCVMKMDHHCPWVNNCVGVNNQKHFVLFCFYTMLLSAYALVLLACRSMFATEGLLALDAAKFESWGKHYLRTLPQMLRSERRSNFRDAALQPFGRDAAGQPASFDALSAAAELVFAELEPPVPSGLARLARQKAASTSRAQAAAASGRVFSPDGKGAATLINNNIVCGAGPSARVFCPDGKGAATMNNTTVCGAR